jgi:arylsulfatase A-like enzyme
MGDGQVVNWITERIAAPGNAPRFLAAGIYRPHNPWYLPESYLAKFPLAQVQLPAVRADDLADLPAIALRSQLNSVESHQWIVQENKWSEGVQYYLASINFADAMVGELLDALDASGRADRTIIVLWADHGFHLGEKERWHKYTLWNESLHVPFIVVAPGVTAPGSRSAAPVSLMDIYPTLAELTGLAKPAHVEGRSLVPLLRNPATAWDHPTLSTYGRGNNAIVSDRYKYIRYSDGSEELYDRRQDPNEWTNLAGQAGREELKRELARHLPQEEAQDLGRPAAGAGGARRGGGGGPGAGGARGGGGGPGAGARGGGGGPGAAGARGGGPAGAGPAPPATPQ